MKYITSLSITVAFVAISMSSTGQDSTDRFLSVDSLFELVATYSTSVAIAGINTELRKQYIEVAKLQRLPGISTALSYGYLSNADIWTPGFKDHLTGDIPHQFTVLSLSGGLTLYKGGLVNESISNAGIEREGASVREEKTLSDTRFKALSIYLDIFMFRNQRAVFQNNARLANERLGNIRLMFKKGMVTQNEVLRSELILSDFQLAVRRSENNLDMANTDLNILTGYLPSHRTLPDSSLLTRIDSVQTVADLIGLAGQQNHELRLANVDHRIAESNLRMIQSERLPQLSFIAASNLQRPFTSTIPSVDIYYNIYQFGLSLQYNISSIYQTKRKVKAGKLFSSITLQKQTLIKQELETAVRNTVSKLNQAMDDLNTYRSDLVAANENYRVVERKYYNQLSLLTDLIDATNIKIEAELKVVNANIAVIQSWYQLKNIIGTLK